MELNKLELGLLKVLEALTERAEKGLDQSSNHDGLINCTVIAKARQVIKQAKLKGRDMPELQEDKDKQLLLIHRCSGLLLMPHPLLGRYPDNLHAP